MYCSKWLLGNFLELKCQLNQASWGVNLGIGTKSRCTLGLCIPLNTRWLILELENSRRGLNLVERLTSLKNNCALSIFIFCIIFRLFCITLFTPPLGWFLSLRVFNHHVEKVIKELIKALRFLCKLKYILWIRTFGLATSTKRTHVNQTNI